MSCARDSNSVSPPVSSIRRRKTKNREKKNERFHTYYVSSSDVDTASAQMCKTRCSSMHCGMLRALIGYTLRSSTYTAAVQPGPARNKRRIHIIRSFVAAVFAAAAAAWEKSSLRVLVLVHKRNSSDRPDSKAAEQIFGKEKKRKPNRRKNSTRQEKEQENTSTTSSNRIKSRTPFVAVW